MSGEETRPEEENAPQSSGVSPSSAPVGRPPENVEPHEAVSAYRKIVGVKGGRGPSVDQPPSEAFSIWSYPTFDEALAAESAQKKALEASNDLSREKAVGASSGDAAKAKKGQKKKKKKKDQKLKLQIAHQTAGRVRMKIPSGKGNPDLLQEVAQTFRIIPGIDKVSINAVTGSIILEYDPDHHKTFNDRLARSMMSHGGATMLGSEFDELARKIENEAEFLAQRSEAARAIVDFFRQADRDIKVATHNVVDLKIVLAVGVIGLTVFEIGAHAATPVWLTLSIFTFNHFLELRNPEEDDESAPALAPVVFNTSG
jgi:hypothetical protein